MNFFVLCGSLSEETGGPTATLTNLAEMAARLGYTPVLVSTGAPGSDRSVGSVSSRQYATGLLRPIRVAWRALRSREPVIVVGVWHYMFFVAAATSLVIRSSPTYLVPTNSLMKWDWDKHRAVKLVLRPIVTLLVSRFAAVVCASSGELTQSIPRLGQRGVVIPHAVRRLGRTPDRRSESPRLVGFVGRVTHQKGLELLIDSCALAPSVDGLMIAGDGDAAYVSDLRRRAQRTGVDLDVTGWLDSPELLSRLGTCAALGIASRAENFCHAAAEAAMCGLPVVVVDRVASATDLSVHPLIETCETTATALSEALESAVRRGVGISELAESEVFYQREWSISAFTNSWMALLLREGSAKVQEASSS